MPLSGRDLDPGERQAGLDAGIVEAVMVKACLGYRYHAPLGRDGEEGDGDVEILRPYPERFLVAAVSLQLGDDLGRCSEPLRVLRRFAGVPVAAAYRPVTGGGLQFPVRAPLIAFM